jgi:hypothetical protein
MVQADNSTLVVCASITAHTIAAFARAENPRPGPRVEAKDPAPVVYISFAGYAITTVACSSYSGA